MKIVELAPDEKLSLKNSGNLEVFFLGVGSAFARKNYQLNLLLIQGDHHVLVDLGMTGPTALDKHARLSPLDIQVLLPTHSHADHVGGIEQWGLMHRYITKSKPKMLITDLYQSILWNGTLKGGMEYNAHIEGNRELNFVDYFNVARPKWKTNQPREILEINEGPIQIEMFRTKHIPDDAIDWHDAFVSYGLFVNGHVFISMDTQFDRALIDFYAPKSSVMFHDVQFFPGAVHAPLADLKTLPDDIKQKMHLMHYSDDWEKQDITGFGGWTRPGVRYVFE